MSLVHWDLHLHSDPPTVPHSRDTLQFILSIEVRVAM